MASKQVKLGGSGDFQDIGTVGQTVEQLAGNMQSVNQILDVGLRNTRNYASGFVRVSDLVDLGFCTLNGNLLTAASLGGTATAITVNGNAGIDTLAFSGATVTVSGTTATITITGGGGSLSVTDGTTTVSSVTSLRFTSGATVTSGGAGIADVTVSGGGSVPVPAQHGGLLYWIDASVIATSAPIVPLLGSPDMSRCPCSIVAINGGLPAGSTLNAKNTLGGSGSSASEYTVFPPFNLSKCTVFVVCTPHSFSNYQSFVSGNNAAMNVQLTQTSGHVGIVSDNVVAIGTSTGVATVGAALQFNTTYDGSTGNWAIRMFRAADSSGTNSISISANTDMVGANRASGAEFMDSDLAELIVYSRVLTLTEIQAIEAYLFAKWGV